jgi:tRNA(adenine34) deaminase
MEPRPASLPIHPGGVRERPNRHAWKACEGQPSVGSNPTPSAMAITDLEAMRSALHEARSAEVHGDVPVGAVVVRGGIIVAARHNERELTGDPTAHAEVLALRDAAAGIGHWRLDDCTLFVTLEPCAMCAGAIVNARVQRVVFGATDPKAGAVRSLFRLADDPRLNHRAVVDEGVCAVEAGGLLTAFFASRRGSSGLTGSTDQPA